MRKSTIRKVCAGVLFFVGSFTIVGLGRQIGYDKGFEDGYNATFDYVTEHFIDVLNKQIESDSTVTAFIVEPELNKDTVVFYLSKKQTINNIKSIKNECK
jgi:hypothetical protein